MAKLADHPTVRAHRSRACASPRRFRAAELRSLALQLGADDVGFVEVEREAIADQRSDIEAALPGTRLLISFVVRMNRGNLRAPQRSLSNLEFHRAGDETNEVAARIVRELEAAGHRAVNPSMGFPMEMDRFPGKVWVVGHKPVAVAAGLGHMGVHRNVIHPRFGNFILLGTVLTDLELEPGADGRAGFGEVLDYNPCLSCKLCVAACPVGAIKADGGFDFSACYTHNYREFMGGFADFVETVADSRSRDDFRGRVRLSETSSMWQSLSFGASYKAAYCVAVCPAGEDVIAPFLADRRQFSDQVLRPLQRKVEPLYVLADSDAEAHAQARFPHKPTRRVKNGLRPQNIAGFLRGLSVSFQRDKAREVELRVHFRFTGPEPGSGPQDATVAISSGRLEISEGHVGDADLAVTADAVTWLAIVAGERRVLGAVLRRQLRVRGPLARMKQFQSCFATG